MTRLLLCERQQRGGGRVTACNTYSINTANTLYNMCSTCNNTKTQKHVCRTTVGKQHKLATAVHIRGTSADRKSYTVRTSTTVQILKIEHKRSVLRTQKKRYAHRMREGKFK